MEPASRLMLLLCALLMLAGCAKTQHPADAKLAVAATLLKQGKDVQAAVEISSAIKCAPSRYETYVAAMQLYRSGKRNADVARIGEQLIEAALSAKLNPRLRDDEIRSLCGSVAAIYWDSGSKSHACAILRKALRATPNDAGLLNDLGYYYAEAGINLPQAVKLAGRAVAMEPGNGAFVDSLGWAQYKSGDYVSALATLKNATSLTPSTPEIRYHLGAAYAKLGRIDQAEIELRKAIKLSPTMTQASALLTALHR